jgi:hypothetical protein
LEPASCHLRSFIVAHRVRCVALDQIAPVGFQRAVQFVRDPTRTDGARIIGDADLGRVLDNPARIELRIFLRNAPNEAPKTAALD